MRTFLDSPRRLVIPVAIFVALVSWQEAHAVVPSTPPNAPKWYAAKVTAAAQVTFAAEFYGPFRKREKAEQFCAKAPKSLRCTVVPLQQPAEWMRKGAR